MTDEKLVEVVKRAAWRSVQGPLVGASDGQTYVVPTLTDALMADICRAAIAAYEAAKGGPAGWVMVPREPTEEMCSAGYMALLALGKRETSEQWKAMLAAAPAAKPA
jgi:hypothetical protein